MKFTRCFFRKKLPSEDGSFLMYSFYASSFQFWLWV